jgi:hypothetical protein
MFYVSSIKVNAPKQYACFLETVFLKQRKNRQTIFLIGTVDKLHLVDILFCLRLNKNNPSAKRSYRCFSTSCNKYMFTLRVREKEVYTLLPMNI